MDKNTIRLKSCISGIGLALFVYMIAYGISCIFYSEMLNIGFSLIIMAALSFVSSVCYMCLEKFKFSKTGSSSFAIGYFGTLALICALVFFITNIVPLSYIFDTNYLYTAIYLRKSCIVLCLFNAIALVIRLGAETLKYIKEVFKTNI